MKYTFTSVYHQYKVYFKCTEFLQGKCLVDKSYIVLISFTLAGALFSKKLIMHAQNVSSSSCLASVCKIIHLLFY